ncbi:hypothetical protein [Aquimarina sediminis]|uniref:hypothetical protein n=1 Tax=Aquimarina sediminis TaxID=2070536 RepID=UPI000CA06F61|nr:hypothetical protein [Aquimarina sediminis]
MKTPVYFIVVFFILSCNNSKNTIASKNSLELNAVSIVDNNFIDKIRELPIQQLPHEFIDCSTDSLQELEQSNTIIYGLNIETDTLLSLNNFEEPLFYKLVKEKIHNETKSYSEKYYSFLLDYIEENTTVSFSDSYVYKRLDKINENIEVLLIITKIIDNKPNDSRIKGIQIDVITYGTLLQKPIDRKRLITTGIGLEDIAYHECFTIDENYNITTKSFMHLEDEATSIKRKLKVKKDGQIKVLSNDVNVGD